MPDGSVSSTAVTKHAGGRPRKFKPDYVDQAKRLSALGLTDEEMADYFEVDRRTFYRWKADFPEFCHAITTAAELADDRVERSLYKRAVGYEADAVKIFPPEKGKKNAKPLMVPYREHVQPDTTAAIFWLKNRRAGKWRDRREVSGPDGGAIDIAVDDKRARVDLARWMAMTLTSATDVIEDATMVDNVPDQPTDAQE